MTTTFPVGWVLRASTIGFAVGCRVPPREIKPDTSVPNFGDLVKVLLPDGMIVFGVIYDVQVRDDPVVRQLILAGDIEEEITKDQRENRLVPVEIGVLAVGYQRAKEIVQGLPPQPPISLDSLILCNNTDIQTFTNANSNSNNAKFKFDYLRLILNAPQIPTDELVVANLLRVAAAYPTETRRQFLLDAGRELARLLSFDLVRLDGILRRIKP
ncbi:MAG: hypothetical protein HC875_11175 [Anaerolineales bacterium]|nr:hypothetical protein [Anaerolineales bacterium]